MSLELLKSPFEKEFESFIKQTRNEFIFSSPYINDKGVSFLLDHIDPANKSINILTNLSAKNIVDDVTQPLALLKICSAFRETKISSLTNLHAKVYIVDETAALVTSANLTYGGLRSNFEYGVLIDDVPAVKSIKQDVLRYADLGFVFDESFLKRIYEKSLKIEKIQEKPDKLRNDSELRSLIEQEKGIDTLLETRYRNRETRHSIFAKTIEFLLHENKQLSTEEIYALVKDIHPEMCDDDYKYSNGEKKWKIEVRQSRFFLQRKGIVVQVPGQPHQWKLEDDFLLSK